MFLCVIVMQLFSFQIDMAESILTQQMKRHAVIVSLAAGHSDAEIAAFLKVDGSFDFKVRSELRATGVMWPPLRKENIIANVLTVSGRQNLLAASKLPSMRTPGNR